MVQSVASDSLKLHGRFALSWQTSAHTVDRLTRKTEIEERCRLVGLNYPGTVVISDWVDASQVLSTLTRPRIIKPSRPLSGFKVHVASTAKDARAFLQLHQEDFPVLLQEWIPGDDSSIHFSALYLDDGRPLARFDGRKLRSYPMGHTTVAEPIRNEAVYEYATAFFDGTGVSGPASLEVKIAPDGRLWVIEPTVGRTDFWLDLCIANGVNLPLIEFNHQTATPVENVHQLDRSVWINAERDPASPAWYLANLQQATRRGRSIRFTYWDFSDPAPAVRGLRRFVRRAWRSLARHARSLGAKLNTGSN
jgi:predicted ATP-grasp superfamily ATP-dependent carboligase